MRTYLECVPCFVQQALDAARRATDDESVHECVVRETIRLAADTPFRRSPPWIGQRIHRLLRDVTGNPDPYHEVKRRSQALAMRWYPVLRSDVLGSGDPFAAAVALAIAGNIIDFGCRSELGDDEVRRAVEDAIDTPLSEAAVAGIREAVDAASDVLYLADNAGEIVFDRLLIEQMPRDRVTLVVRGSPVINDATREDVVEAGLDSLVAYMDNGSDAPGTILESCSSIFRSRFARCDLVVAKGQGNYETLNEHEKSMVFLFKAKCPVVARDVGCEVGQMIIAQHGGGSEHGALGEPICVSPAG
jgi:uncharacterized protein with ATP-grasp and redox domains